MTENLERSPLEPTEGQMIDSNNGTPPLSLRKQGAQCSKSALQRMRVLIRAVHDLSNKANDMILYPNLAFHLLPYGKRQMCLSVLRSAKRFQDFYLPQVREVGWLRDQVQRGVLAECRHTRAVADDPNGEKRTLQLLHKLFENTQTPHITGADLMELPRAAWEIGFSGSFSLLESFFLLHLRLKPLFIGIQAPRANDKTGEELSAWLDVADLGGGSVDVAEQVRIGLAAVIAKLGEAGQPAATDTPKDGKQLMSTRELSPATRFLGALTWDVWEKGDLTRFIDLLHKAEQAEAYRLAEAVSNQQGKTPQRSRLELAREEHLRQRCPNGLTLVEWKRSLDPLPAIGEEIAYCRWLLETMRQKELVGVIVPSLEGVGCACSKEALFAFWDSLIEELASTNKVGGIDGLWNDDCKHSQGSMVTATWLLRQWGQHLNPVAVPGLPQTLPPQQALDAFREGVERSNKTLFERLQEEVERFVQDLLLCQSNLHWSINDLRERIIAASALTNQFAAQVTDEGEELTDWECLSSQMCTNKRSTLHNRLRRLGVNEASIASVHPSDIEFCSLSAKIHHPKLSGATPAAVDIAKCVNELHTFWIHETGHITNLHPTKSSKGGGTWKVQFLRYITYGSREFVTSALERFCEHINTI